MSIYEIELKDLEAFVEAAYIDDEDLFFKYHIDEYSFEEAVGVTMDMIERTGFGLGMRYFGVSKENNKIGYLAILPNNLYSFGINIRYRNKPILEDFWGGVKMLLGNSFICMLYPNNTRAINWLIKCGMVIVEDVEENCVTLLNIK